MSSIIAEFKLVKPTKICILIFAFPSHNAILLDNIPQPWTQHIVNNVKLKAMFNELSLKLQKYQQSIYNIVLLS